VKRDVIPSKEHRLKVLLAEELAAGNILRCIQKFPD